MLSFHPAKYAPNAEWRLIPSLRGIYEASDNGRIRHARKHNILKQHLAWNGYALVSCAMFGGRAVNRLVCEAFKGPPPTPQHQAAHRDGDRLNNASSNLDWLTRQENYQDQIRHGTDRKGSRHHMAKLSEADIVAIRARAANGELQSILASDYGVTQGRISIIVARKQWGHV